MRARVAEADRITDVRSLYGALAAGKIDRGLLTAHASSYFDEIVRGDYRSSLGPLGVPTKVELLGKPRLRGGFVNRNYRIEAGGKTLTAITYAEPGATGRWEQFLVMP